MFAFAEEAFPSSSLKVMNEEEQLLAKQSPDGRIFELDALRGVAACIVLFHHFRFMFSMDPPRMFLRPLFAGRYAVAIFFTLSGFVLSLSYWRGRQIRYPLFLVRRFFRIYMPYAAACALAVLVALPLLNSIQPLTPWFYRTWHSSLTPILILRQLTLFSTDAKINTAFWSIRYEIEFSIAFPLLCALITRLRFAGTFALATVCAIVGSWISRHGLSSTTIELGNTIQWSSCFLYGAALAQRRREILHWYQGLYPLGRLAIFLLACVGFFTMQDLPMIFSSCALIVVVQDGILRRVLRTSLPEYLGRISYSLYLLHGTVLFALFILLYQKVPVSALFLGFFALSFLLAHIFNQFVEEPFDRLGKRLTRR